MNKIVKTIIAVSLAAVALGSSYLLYQRMYGGTTGISVTEPSAVKYDFKKTAAEKGIVSDYLWMRIKQLMLEDDLLIPSSYMIAGRLSYQEAWVCDEYRLSDQAALLLMYVRNGDRLSALKLKDQIFEYYDFESLRNAQLSDFLDSYLIYCARYGTGKDLDRAGELVDILFDEEGNMREESLDVAVYRQDGFYSTERIGDGRLSTLEQGAEADTEFTVVTGIEISSVNLRLIRNLEENGFLPDGSYERNLRLVEDAVIGSDLPLYAYAYSDGSYIYSHDRAAAVDIRESVITMRHLSEAGKLPDASYNWIKNQILNSGTLCDEYYYALGTTDGSEAFDIYPDIMLIAIEADDPDLYEAVCGIEGMRVATLSTSPALHMIFRNEDGRFVFYARENLLVCLAVT